MRRPERLTDMVGELSPVSASLSGIDPRLIGDGSAFAVAGFGRLIPIRCVEADGTAGDGGNSRTAIVDGIRLGRLRQRAGHRERQRQLPSISTNLSTNLSANHSVILYAADLRYPKTFPAPEAGLCRQGEGVTRLSVGIALAGGDRSVSDDQDLGNRRAVELHGGTGNFPEPCRRLP